MKTTRFIVQHAKSHNDDGVNVQQWDELPMSKKKQLALLWNTTAMTEVGYNQVLHKPTIVATAV